MHKDPVERNETSTRAWWDSGVYDCVCMYDMCNGWCVWTLLLQSSLVLTASLLATIAFDIFVRHKSIRHAWHWLRFGVGHYVHLVETTRVASQRRVLRSTNSMLVTRFCLCLMQSNVRHARVCDQNLNENRLERPLQTLWFHDWFHDWFHSWFLVMNFIVSFIVAFIVDFIIEMRGSRQRGGRRRTGVKKRRVKNEEKRRGKQRGNGQGGRKRHPANDASSRRDATRPGGVGGPCQRVVGGVMAVIHFSKDVYNTWQW